MSSASQPAAQRAVFDGIVRGTAGVLDTCDRAGARHVLVASSGAVYGTQPPELPHIPEIYPNAPDPLVPSNGYGQGKRVAEWLASEHAARTGASVGIARIFALVGPNLPLDGSFAAGNFIRDALAGQPLSVNSDGRTLRSYLYIADACVWLLRILGRGTGCRAYNVGSESAISIAGLAQAVVRASNVDVPVHVRNPVDAASPAPRYVPSTARARQELGVAEYTDLSDALSKTINWSRIAAM